MENSPWHKISREGNKLVLLLSGAWRLRNLRQILNAVGMERNALAKSNIVINGGALEALDTSGALLLCRTLCSAGIEVDKAELAGFRPEHAAIFELVRENFKTEPSVEKRKHISLAWRVGEASMHFYQMLVGVLAFIGETSFEVWRTVFKPQLLRLRELFVQLELVCMDAIPVVALVTALIGVVIAYLFAGQIEKYGVSIVIVDGVSISMCRELSPVLVALIVAGRSGSAFTAQIGTMKLNEELDALKTLGLSPMRILVLPRFFALVLAMPLLVFVGDVVGILGGMVVADLKLGITMPTFIERLQVVLPPRSIFVGLIKAPVFAAFIAVIGCRMGLTVENNARSVGIHTTSTVVQSIVCVILLNAAFAVIFVELGI